MDERFLQSLFTRRHCVLGKRLQPFSLAHRVTLIAIDSPIIKENGSITFKDLALAVGVCSRRNPFNHYPKISFSNQIRYRLAKKFPRYFYHHADEFIAYLEDCCSHPKILSDEDNDEVGKPYSLPWCLTVVAVLMRSGCMSEQSAWTLPEGRALWLYTAFNNLEGGKFKVISTDEEKVTLDKFAEWDRIEKQTQ